MTNDLPIESLLDDYFNGEFPASEWQNKLPGYTDTEINALVSRHRAAMVYLQRASVLNQVQSIHHQFLAEKTSLQRNSGKLVAYPWRKFLSVAAMLIIIAGSFLVYQLRAVSPEQLYGNLYSDYQLSTFRSETGTSEMESLYAEGRWAELTAVYSKLERKGRKEDFLAAMSFLKLKQFPAAENIFDKLLVNSRQEDALMQEDALLFRDEAQYYGALAKIRTGKFREAYELLSLVRADKEHTYFDRVSERPLKQLLQLTEKHPQ